MTMMEGVIDLPKVPKANEGVVVMAEIQVVPSVVLAMATTPAVAATTIRKRRRSNNILHHHHHVHHHPNITLALETVAMVILPLLLQAHDNNGRNGSRKQSMIQDQKNLVVIII